LAAAEKGSDEATDARNSIGLINSQIAALRRSGRPFASSN
jgi:hypothetical protein